MWGFRQLVIIYFEMCLGSHINGVLKKLQLIEKNSKEEKVLPL